MAFQIGDDATVIDQALQRCGGIAVADHFHAVHDLFGQGPGRMGAKDGDFSPPLGPDQPWPGPSSGRIRSSRPAKVARPITLSFMGMTTATSISPQITEKIRAVLRQLNGVIAGKPAQVQGSVVCLLAGGHLLIEDVPGVGKTTLAQALARTFEIGRAHV